MVSLYADTQLKYESLSLPWLTLPSTYMWRSILVQTRCKLCVLDLTCSRHYFSTTPFVFIFFTTKLIEIQLCASPKTLWIKIINDKNLPRRTRHRNVTFEMNERNIHRCNLYNTWINTTPKLEMWHWKPNIWWVNWISVKYEFGCCHIANLSSSSLRADIQMSKKLRTNVHDKHNLYLSHTVSHIHAFTHYPICIVNSANIEYICRL